MVLSKQQTRELMSQILDTQVLGAQALGTQASETQALGAQVSEQLLEPLLLAAGTITVGVDVVEIADIQRVYERCGLRFCQRILTACELETFSKLKNVKRALAYLSKQFAVKEAFFKACGSGLTAGFSWQDLSVLRNEQGAPQILLQADFFNKLLQAGTLPQYRSSANRLCASVSISDSEHLVFAEVLLQVL